MFLSLAFAKFRLMVILDDLQRLRSCVDTLDEQVLTLLLQRFAYVREIASIKRCSGQEVYDPKREQEILLRIRRLAEKSGKVSEGVCEALVRIFSEIILLSRRHQETSLGGNTAAASLAIKGEDHAH